MFLECENISFILAFDCLWNYANIGIIPEGFCSLFQLFWWHSRFCCPLLNVQLVDEEISWKENQWNSMKFLRIRQFSIQLHIIINVREKKDLDVISMAKKSNIHYIEIKINNLGLAHQIPVNHEMQHKKE